MIIECPNCGVPGRIPAEALGRIRVAHCTLCGHRFELQAEPPAIGPDASAADSSEAGLDSCSSSYELKALIDEDGDRLRADRPVAQDPAPSAGVRRLAGSTQRSSPPGPDPVGLAEAARAAWALNPNEPWYARVLQAWGVVFLVWAGVLLIRSLYLTVASLGDTARSLEIMPTMVGMLLLVPGAAGLFLLADLGRYIRGLQASPAPQQATAVSNPAPGHRAAPARRSWRPRHAPLRFLGSRIG